MFHLRRKNINDHHVALTTNNTNMLRVSQCKYLGVLFESDMHWKPQINSVCSKLAYGCHILLRARESFGLSILRILYFSFVHSQYYLETCMGQHIQNILRPCSSISKTCYSYNNLFKKYSPQYATLSEATHITRINCI